MGWVQWDAESCGTVSPAVLAGLVRRMVRGLARAAAACELHLGASW